MIRFKDPFKKKEAFWEDVLGERQKELKERYMEIYKNDMRRVKRCM